MTSEPSSLPPFHIFEDLVAKKMSAQSNNNEDPNKDEEEVFEVVETVPLNSLSTAQQSRLNDFLKRVADHLDEEAAEQEEATNNSIKDKASDDKKQQ
jgi:hypothetical protein